MATLIRVRFKEQRDRKPRREETRVAEVRTQTEAVLVAAKAASSTFGDYFEVRNSRLIATIDVREDGSAYFKGRRVGK